ncbi:MAG: ATP-binding cassette domain-containing protein, partial [Longimicrobiales bacterium]|nr:ATP-binding cassette domain-containing protein [Longimicrobiales bacterium]
LPEGRAIDLDHVSFRYEGAATDAISEVSLHLEPGRHYGLVGRTGSGKTTALDVILGLLRPTSGEVRIGGERLSARATAVWRRTVGYVPQEVFLLDASIRQNIAFGEPDATIDESRVERAARIAALEEVLADLPEGLDTEVGERGVRLSGGQRQRIGIARALYHDPDIVFFDEGTSALDGETEARVVRNLREGGRMLVMVAHRLASIENADEIFVFDRARVVARGTAAELERESEVWRAIAQQGGADETALSSSTPTPSASTANP